MWEEKRKRILQRDNYTCQMCNTFNSQIGRVEFFNEKYSCHEMHEYDNYANSSVYRISHDNPSFTFEIDFCDRYLVMPVMQVHHKRYIRGRQLWEYDDKDLITLCKSCHTELHKNCNIPVYNSDNKYQYEHFEPIDLGTGRQHNHLPWRFIKITDQKEYIVTDVFPKISMVLFAHENQDQMQQKAQSILNDFIKTYLPDYAPMK